MGETQDNFLVTLVVARIVQRHSKYVTPDLFQTFMRTVRVNDMSADNHEPMLLRIGLNKWDRTKLDVMEFYKHLYMMDFFGRLETDLEQFLKANLSSLREPISRFKLYINWGDVADEMLIEMFIINGCFIIELFLKNNDLVKKANDILFKSELLLAALSRDLLLLDNQLPFQVLQILFVNSGLLEKLRQHDPNHPDLIELAFKFLNRILPTKNLVKELVRFIFPDLRSIVYDGLSWLSVEANNNSISNNDQDIEKDGDDKWNLVKSATELLEFGVEFEVIKTDKFTDINFTEEGVLKIPCIPIRYGTAYSINMLLEVENHFLYNIHSSVKQNWISDYVWFMNSLLKSPSDVQLLRQKKIIDNLSELRDDAAILKFLKESYESLTISPQNFSYRKTCRDLNKHCNHKRNRWVAKLKRDYFNSPWAYISFFAALLLLILTIVQTIFSATSYYKGG